MEESVRPVAVITGASSGIGQATALAFAHARYDVVLAARQEDSLYSLASEIEGLGVSALPMPTDVTVEGQVEALAQEAVNRFGRIDVWVNNAAVGIFGKFDEIRIEDFRQAIDVDMWGYVYGARAAMRRFRQQGRGSLINVTSLEGKVGAPWAAPYAMAKGAVLMMNQSLREEFVDEPDIHVSALIPASIDTPFFEHAADFVGREVQAMPPVYPAKDVAREILRLVSKPKPEAYVGQMPYHMRFLHAHLKKPFERIYTQQVWKTHFSDSAAPGRQGILFEPKGMHANVSGGWPHQVGGMKGKAMLAGVVGAIGGIAAVGVWATTRHRTA